MRKKIKNLLESEVVTITEFARALGLSPRTIQTEVRRGKYTAVKKGKTYLLDKRDLDTKKRA